MFNGEAEDDRVCLLLTATTFCGLRFSYERVDVIDECFEVLLGQTDDISLQRVKEPLNTHRLTGRVITSRFCHRC